ncbi:hypothetical protein [Pararhodobacter sp. CCB-MM2]|uniref:hypothetical protein n=1 Tax=Pararhodobacter sp. CCB-MM2 TaxID=1786003 RepID=UPI001112C117|nr:hypothetical protein [Pararhodobacter sp. CCB-MM2]
MATTAPDGKRCPFLNPQKKQEDEAETPRPLAFLQCVLNASLANKVIVGSDLWHDDLHTGTIRPSEFERVGDEGAAAEHTAGRDDAGRLALPFVIDPSDGQCHVRSIDDPEIERLIPAF